MAEDRKYQDRIRKWFLYAKLHPWQGAVLLILGVPSILLLDLFQRRIEIWGDDLLVKHGDDFAYRIGIVLLDFIAQNPIWSIVFFGSIVVLGLFFHAYIATTPFSEEPEKPKQLVVLSRSDHDPCIIPRYDKSATATAGINNSDWFVLSNDGQTEAYDVLIEPFQVGDTIISFQTIPLIKAAKFEIAKHELADVHHGKQPNYGLAIAFGSAWSSNETSADHLIFRQNARMKYRTRENKHFCTEFTLAYDARREFINIENIRHLSGYECERCGHQWVPRQETTEEPKVCPKCKSPYWNTPRQRPKTRK